MGVNRTGDRYDEFNHFAMIVNCKRFALPASAQPSLREGSGTPKSSVGKVRIPEAGSRQVRQAGLAWLGWATG